MPKRKRSLLKTVLLKLKLVLKHMRPIKRTNQGTKLKYGAKYEKEF